MIANPTRNSKQQTDILFKTISLVSPCADRYDFATERGAAVEILVTMWSRGGKGQAIRRNRRRWQGRPRHWKARWRQWQSAKVVVREEMGKEGQKTESTSDFDCAADLADRGPVAAAE